MKNKIKNVVAVILAVVVCMASTITIFAKSNENDKSSDDTTVRAVQSAKVTTTTAKFTPYYRYVKVGKSNVRNKASSKGKVVKTYYKGKKVKVISHSGNWRKIGKDLWVHKDNLCAKDPMGSYKGVKLKYYGTYNITKNKLTRSKGVVYYNGHKETWYSSKEYGQTKTAYSIPDKHLGADGTYRDKDGYICIASNYLKKGAIIMTSLGVGKVYDRGGMRGKWIDIYTNW